MRSQTKRKNSNKRWRKVRRMRRIPRKWKAREIKKEAKRRDKRSWIRENQSKVLKTQTQSWVKRKSLISQKKRNLKTKSTGRRVEKRVRKNSQGVKSRRKRGTRRRKGESLKARTGGRSRSSRKKTSHCSRGELTTRPKSRKELRHRIAWYQGWSRQEKTTTLSK